MSVQTTRRLTPWDALVSHPARWVLRRIALYAIAAVGPMILITAGAAFYAYVWPGVPAIPHRETPPIVLPPSVPSTPTDAPRVEIPIAKLDQKDVLGKNIYDQNGVFLGHIVRVNLDEKGTIISVDFSEATKREASVPATNVKAIKSNGNDFTFTTVEKNIHWYKPFGNDPIKGPDH